MTHYYKYIMSCTLWFFTKLFKYLKWILWARNLFFIYSIYGPFAKLTAHHTKIHDTILSFILLFICLSTYLKCNFTKVKYFSVALWEEKVQREAGANHQLCHLKDIYR